MAEPARSIQAGADYPELERRMARRVKLWRTDHRRFIGEALGAEPTEQQSAFLGALIDQARPRVAVRSGHGTGKSTGASWACWHRLICYPDARVPISAPTKHQLEDILWSEISKWHDRLEPWLRVQFQVLNDVVRFKNRPKTWFAVGRTGRKESPDALQGFHGDNLLFCVDEASGVPDALFEPVSGALTGKGNQILITSNPVRLLGYLYDAFNKNRSRWSLHTLNSEESPLVAPEWCQEMAEHYGADSDIYRMRVLGLHPRAAVGQLIPIDLVQAAMKRDYPEQDWIYSPKVLGVDCARYGDDASVIIRRQGLKAWGLERYRGDRALDTMALAGRVASVCNEWDPDAVFVDAVGVGAGVVDRLYQLGWGDRLIEVTAGSKATDDGRFYNLRAEMWWRLKEWLGKGALPQDTELLEDLVGPLYQHDLKGRVQVERKKDMKKRGLASPDSADALVHTFVQPVQAKHDPLAHVRPSGETADTGYDWSSFGRA